MLDEENPEWIEKMFRTANFGQCAAIRNQLRRAAAISHEKYISIRLSPEVVQFFKKHGSGWQARLNQVLLEYIEKQQN